MMEVASTFVKRPTCLFWSEVEKWTPTSSHLRFGKLPDGWQLLPVSAFAKQIENKEKVVPEREYRMAGVRGNGGGAFHRETVLGKEQSSNYLYPVKPGVIIYNRLFAWKASFAVVGEDFSGFYVSNEFPQFEIDQRIAFPKYVYLLFTTNKIIGAVKAASIGSAAVSRNRFIESELLSFKIPIPPLPVQQKIVAHWESVQQERTSSDAALSALVSELHLYLVKQTRAFDQVTRSRVFIANYENTQQWDVKAGRASAFITANADFIRLGDYIEECTETVRPWEKPEKKWPIYGVNNKEGVFLSSIQVGKDFNAPYKKIEKDWFFHNPTRANVGSLGIVPEVPDGAITSPEYQVWRLKGCFLADFVALMIRTDYFLSLVAFNRVGGVKQRMYYSNLAEIRLPMVDLGTQEQYAAQRRDILDRISDANAMLIERKREIEKMILGSRKVEDN
jgi:restriction endonuclease S subunit